MAHVAGFVGCVWYRMLTVMDDTTTRSGRLAYCWGVCMPD